MTDQELRDALVEAGILSRSPHDSPLYQLRYEGIKWLHVEQIITDWRVAGKVLESIDSGKTITILMDDDRPCVAIDTIFGGNAHCNESLPRAIIEAWYEARQ